MFALLLALSLSQDIESTSAKQVDSELLEIVADGQSGLLFHGATHSICGATSRRDRIARFRRAFFRLRQEYIALGGQLPMDEEMPFWQEATHKECFPGSEWSGSTRYIERTLARMRNLIERKRSLARSEKIAR